jgi:acyl dehydratase
MSAVTAPRFPPGVLGAEIRPVSQHVDARWLMAYAAGLGETHERFFDTRAEIVAHPLFPVCYEWAPLVALREQVVGDELAPLSVHATHDLVITRMPRPGTTVTTTARVIAVERRRSGTSMVARLTTVDGAGSVLTTTDYGSVYRGVEPSQTGRLAEPLVPVGHTDASAPVDLPPRWTERVEITAGAAHVYTECARIWNPIHTDAAVAHAAGLPAIILHGTATLALAVSRVVTHELGGDPARVRRIRARFTGFVRLPSTLTVRGRGQAGHAIAFDAVGPDGASVLGEGVLTA